jgi:hypothetical protein
MGIPNTSLRETLNLQRKRHCQSGKPKAKAGMPRPKFGTEATRLRRARQTVMQIAPVTASRVARRLLGEQQISRCCRPYVRNSLHNGSDARKSALVKSRPATAPKLAGLKMQPNFCDGEFHHCEKQLHL